MHPDAGTGSRQAGPLPLWILATLLAVATAWIPAGLPGLLSREWAVMGLAAAALATALLTLGGNLPGQNLAALGVIVVGIAWGFHSLPEALFLRPPPRRLEMVSRALLDAAGILVARGVARRLLMPVRSSPRFGLWLIGTACVLAAAWSVPVRLLAFPGTPPTPVRHAAGAAVALVAVTPWILSKRPVPEHIELARSSDEEKRSQLQRLADFQSRHAAQSPAMLARLQQAVISNDNVFEVLMDAVRVCSLGQITNALFEVGGQYRRSM